MTCILCLSQGLVCRKWTIITTRTAASIYWAIMTRQALGQGLHIVYFFLSSWALGGRHCFTLILQVRKLRTGEIKNMSKVIQPVSNPALSQAQEAWFKSPCSQALHNMASYKEHHEWICFHWLTPQISPGLCVVLSATDTAKNKRKIDSASMEINSLDETPIKMRTLKNE